MKIFQRARDANHPEAIDFSLKEGGRRVDFDRAGNWYMIGRQANE